MVKPRLQLVVTEDELARYRELKNEHGCATLSELVRRALYLLEQKGAPRKGRGHDDAGA